MVIDVDTGTVVAEYTRHTDAGEDDEGMKVAEKYTLTRVAGELRIRLSKVFHG